MKTGKRSLAVLSACVVAGLAFQNAAAQSRADDYSGGQSNDAAITARVESVLKDQMSYPTTQLNVETKNGIVQLSGFVHSENDIDRAEAIASRIPSVRGVENYLQELSEGDPRPAERR